MAAADQDDDDDNEPEEVVSFIVFAVLFLLFRYMDMMMVLSRSSKINRSHIVPTRLAITSTILDNCKS